jgi:hypothetical protein
VLRGHSELSINAMFALAGVGLVIAWFLLTASHLWADRIAATSCLALSLGLALRSGPARRRWPLLVWAAALVLCGAFLLIPSGDRPALVGYCLAAALVLIVVTIQLRRPWR